MRFSAEIWAKICLKMRIFLEKSCKITAASGDPLPKPRWPPAAEDFAPRPLRCYSPLLI